MFGFLLVCLVSFTHSAYATDDYLEAIKISAYQGDAGAQFNLGSMYDNGEAVPEDNAEAMRWYHKAAEQRHAGAQSNLGIMYAKGEGVPQDDVQAYAWLSIAAAQGYDKAKKAKEILPMI